MSQPHRVSGPQFRADDAKEHEAVRTTIVGGRPPGSGQPVGPIPRGIEVLIKKAAVDAEFRTLLLERRAEAAGEIGLVLEPAEAAMLAAAPAAQLEAIIDQTTVLPAHRRAFLGKAGKAMLAVVGGAAVVGLLSPAGAGCDWPGAPPAPAGIAPDTPPAPAGERPDMPPEESIPESMGEPERGEFVIRGIRADEPPPPPPPPAPTGIRPDMPPE